MEDADSGEDAPREVVGETGAEPGVAASAASASGTAGEQSTEPVPADGGHDAGDEEEGGADDGTQEEVRKDPVVENLERLLKERREQRTRTTDLRKEIKKAQKQRARIKKNATRLTDEDLMAVIRARGIDPSTAASSSG